MSQTAAEHEQATIPPQSDVNPNAVGHKDDLPPLALPSSPSMEDGNGISGTPYTISSDQNEFPACNEYNSSKVDDKYFSDDNTSSNNRYSSDDDDDDSGGYSGVGCNIAIGNEISEECNRKRKLGSTFDEGSGNNLKFTDPSSPHNVLGSFSTDDTAPNGGHAVDGESKVNILNFSIGSPVNANPVTQFEEPAVVPADNDVGTSTDDVTQVAVRKTDTTDSEIPTVPSSYYFVDRAPSSHSTSGASSQSSSGNTHHSHRQQSGGGSGHGHSGYHRSSHGDKSSSRTKERSSHGSDKFSHDGERSSSHTGDRYSSSSHGGDRSFHRHTSTSSSQRSAQPARDPDEGKIFVGGLSWDTTDESLRTYFSKYGRLSDSVVMKTPEGKTRGFAFVTFEVPSVVDEIISQTHYVDGKRVDPKPAIPRDAQHKSEKMFIGGLPWGTTEEELKRYFSSYGTVLSATLMMDQESNQSRGFGFVTFQSANDLQNALSCQPHTIKGQTVETTRALPKTKYGDGASPSSSSSADSFPPASKRAHIRGGPDTANLRYNNHPQQQSQPLPLQNQYQYPGAYQHPGQPHLPPHSGSPMLVSSYYGGAGAPMHQQYGGMTAPSQQGQGYGTSHIMQPPSSIGPISPGSSGVSPMAQPQMGSGVYAPHQYGAGNRPAGPGFQQQPPSSSYVNYGQNPPPYAHPQYGSTPSSAAQFSQLGYMGPPTNASQQQSKQGFPLFSSPNMMQSHGAQQIVGMQNPGSYYQQPTQQPRGSFYGVVPTSSASGSGGQIVTGTSTSSQQHTAHPSYYGNVSSVASGASPSSYYSAMPSTYFKQTGPPGPASPLQSPYQGGVPMSSPSTYQRGPVGGGMGMAGGPQQPPLPKPNQSSYYTK